MSYNPNRLFDDDTPSINDSAFKNLPAGTADYDVVKAGLHRKEGSDKLSVNISFKGDNGEVYTSNLRIQDDNEISRRLARGIVKAMWDVSGLGGDPGLDRIPNFQGKRFRLTVEHSEADSQGRVFANIRSVEKPATASTGTPPDDKDDEVPMEHTTDKPADTTPAETPAAPRKWKGGKK